MAKEYRVTGFDQYGLPRVYGVGPTLDVAETEAVTAAREYVARRRDTGPLHRWTYTHTSKSCVL